MKLTPWFAGTVKPARLGMYRAQDQSMRCGCCWIDLHWNGREWHSDLFTPGLFRTLHFKGNVRRWRGRTAP